MGDFSQWGGMHAGEAAFSQSVAAADRSPLVGNSGAGMALTASFEGSARRAARRWRQPLGSQHYLLALWQQPCAAADALRAAGITDAELMGAFDNDGCETPGCLERVRERLEGLRVRHPEHDASLALLASLVGDAGSRARTMLGGLGVDVSQLWARCALPDVKAPPGLAPRTLKLASEPPQVHPRPSSPAGAGGTAGAPRSASHTDAQRERAFDTHPSREMAGRQPHLGVRAGDVRTSSRLLPLRPAASVTPLARHMPQGSASDAQESGPPLGWGRGAQEAARALGEPGSGSTPRALWSRIGPVPPPNRLVRPHRSAGGSGHRLNGRPAHPGGGRPMNHHSGRPHDRPADSDTPRAPFYLNRRDYPVLARFGRNLCELAAEGKLEQVFGREAEVQEMLDVLARRQGRNPLLIGPPGVGKTSLVEALAIHWVDKVRAAGLEAQEPPILIELSAAGLMAGTGVRGALGERLQRLLAEVEAGQGRIVLFIDEIHALAAASDGSEEAVAELKRALCGGSVALIGATTADEYKRFIERDPALKRRFTVVNVHEPAPEAAREMLARTLPRFAEHHQLAYNDDALDAAIALSVRYLRERHLPEKALTLLDTAGARAARRQRAHVDAAAIAEVVAGLTGVPVARLLERDQAQLLNIESELAQRLVGHAHIWPRLGDALRRGHARLNPKGSLPTLLLLGPSGVGKTETAKVLADVLFGPGAMTRIDMSELSESHGVAQLFGAPPGYIGHGKGGILTEALRRSPYQLILLDEIEKAHPEVLLALLPLLDEGRVRDATGREIEAPDALIVMTSNLGALAGNAVTRARVGFGEAVATSDFDEGKCLSAARAALPAELWNRFDEVLVYGTLDEAACLTWAEGAFQTLAAQVRARTGAEVSVAEGAAERLLARTALDGTLGIRHLRRAFAHQVEAWVSRRLLSSAQDTNAPWCLDVAD